MPDPNQILEITVPLSPLLRPGEDQARPTTRLRPHDSLDLKHLLRELRPSTLTTLSVAGKPWSVVSVFSPYTPDLHVMLLEASADRYLPAPEQLQPDEGERLMALWSALAELLGARESCDTLCVGYNWSPRAWGKVEERGGFQSLPTKWHPMFWSWPEMPAAGDHTDFARWIDFDRLPAPARRVMGENRYAEPMGGALRDRILTGLPPAGRGFVGGEWQTDSMGLRVAMQASSLVELFEAPGWFTDFLRPVSAAAAAMMRDLTESLTSMRFRTYDELLAGIERGRLPQFDRQALRAPPDLRPYTEVEAAWRAHDLPPELLPELYAAAEARCRQSGPVENWWRKGFGYALVMTEDRRRRSVTLRLLPGVYVGPGGVVEAQRIVLRRPEDRQSDPEAVRRRSDQLWSLAAKLEQRFSTVT